MRCPKIQGFTLIELVVSVGILATLFAITLVAVNPGKQFQDSRNTQRRSDANAILNAIHQYAADHNGALPAGLTEQKRFISSGDANICNALVTKYLAALPVDPIKNIRPISKEQCGSGYDTGYQVQASSAVDGDNRVTITAPFAENTEIVYIR